jgi:DNA-binding GntR family transcriptional regulator
MPPAVELLRLQELHQRFAAVVGRRDWDALAEIDQAIREQLQELARRPALHPKVQQARHRLQLLHGHALELCTQECERLRQLLLTHLEYAEGRTAYMRINYMQDEG